ncbi:hypothetical protein MBT84_06145 [Streptomyces sp. MBT84]|nr:hypothetical protein [Streptomyces sp. MBT84]
MARTKPTHTGRQGPPARVEGDSAADSTETVDQVERSHQGLASGAKPVNRTEISRYQLARDTGEGRNRSPTSREADLETSKLGPVQRRR